MIGNLKIKICFGQCDTRIVHLRIDIEEKTIFKLLAGWCWLAAFKRSDWLFKLSEVIY
jgi:hypothetical protein